MEKEKRFIITQEQREEVFELINSRSLLGAKNLLNQLEELDKEEPNPENDI